MEGTNANSCGGGGAADKAGTQTEVWRKSLPHTLPGSGVSPGVQTRVT